MLARPGRRAVRAVTTVTLAIQAAAQISGHACHSLLVTGRRAELVRGDWLRGVRVRR